MKLPRVLLATAALLSTGIYFTYRIVESPGEGPAAATVVAQHSSATNAGLLTSPLLSTSPDSRNPEGKADDMAALREEVAFLRAEVSSLRRQMPRQTQANTDTQATDNSRTDPTARAEAERSYQKQMAAVESAFRNEKTDTKWSISAASVVQQALTSDESMRPNIGNVECRSNTCRVEITDDGSGGLSKSLPMFAQQVGQTFPTMTVNNIDQGNGVSSMVFYLSRNGPQPGS